MVKWPQLAISKGGINGLSRASLPSVSNERQNLIITHPGIDCWPFITNLYFRSIESRAVCQNLSLKKGKTAIIQTNYRLPKPIIVRIHYYQCRYKRWAATMPNNIHVTTYCSSDLTTQRKQFLPPFSTSSPNSCEPGEQKRVNHLTRHSTPLKTQMCIKIWFGPHTRCLLHKYLQTI